MPIDGLNAVRYYFSIRMQIKQRMLRSFLEDSYYANLLAPILPLLSNAPFFSTKSVFSTKAFDSSDCQLQLHNRRQLTEYLIDGN